VITRSWNGCYPAYQLQLQLSELQFRIKSVHPSIGLVFHMPQAMAQLRIHLLTKNECFEYAYPQTVMVMCGSQHCIRKAWSSQAVMDIAYDVFMLAVTHAWVLQV
jgi:hypothetical protein